MAQIRKTATLTAGKQNMAYSSASTTTKQRTVGKTRSKKRLRVKGGAFRRVAVILLIFIVAVAFINQYSRIINVGAQINEMEKEIKSIQMLTDALEAQVIQMVNWDQIEYIAKTKLNMIEPTANSYTTMELKKLPQEYTQQKTARAQESETSGAVTDKISSVFAWLTN